MRPRLQRITLLLALLPAGPLAASPEGLECVLHEWAVPPGVWTGSGDTDPTPLLMTPTTRWAFRLDHCSLSTGTCDVFGSGSRTFQNGSERGEWYPTDTEPTISSPGGNTVVYDFSMRDAFVPFMGQPRFEDMDWTLTAELPSPPSDSPSAAELAAATSLGVEITHWVDNTLFVISWSGGATETVFTSCTPAAAELTIDDVTLAEGSGGGATDAVFTVTRSHDLAAVSVTAQTADGSATAPSDYAAVGPLVLDFPAGGPLTRTLTVEVAADATVELDETFTVELSAPTNATIADGSGLGSIANDDSATVSIDSVSQAEGSGGGETQLSFTVTLDGTVDADVALDVDSSDGTAEDEGGDGDYTAIHGTLAFPAARGQTLGVEVTVTADDVPERDETFFVDLSNLDAGGRAVTLGVAQGQATLIDDDDACPAHSIYRQPYDSPPAAAGHPATRGAEVTFEDIVDDDGNLTTLPPGPVSSVRLWGLGDAGGAVCALDPAVPFHLAAAIDAAGVPGALVAERNDLVATLTVAGDATTRIDLDFEPFEGGTVSWISIQRDEVAGCAFRWLVEPFADSYDNQVFVPPGPAPDDAYLCLGHSRIFADGFESGDTSGWSATVP